MEILVAHGAIDLDDRALLEGLARKHLKRHGEDVERSLAALDAVVSTRENLAKIDDSDPDIEATFSRPGSGATEPVDGRTPTTAPSTATPDGRRFRILRPHALLERITNPLLPNIYNLGCAHARLAAPGDPAGRAPTPEEQSNMRAHADQAMATLRRAVAGGYRNILGLRADPDLDPLRSRLDFRMLLLDAAFPDDPFAPSTEPSHARPRP